MPRAKINRREPVVLEVVNKSYRGWFVVRALHERGQ
jgi:hypothetical protein